MFHATHGEHRLRHAGQAPPQTHYRVPPETGLTLGAVRARRLGCQAGKAVTTGAPSRRSAGGAAAEGFQPLLGLGLQIARGPLDDHLVVDFGHARLALLPRRCGPAPSGRSDRPARRPAPVRAGGGLRRRWGPPGPPNSPGRQRAAGPPGDAALPAGPGTPAAPPVLAAPAATPDHVCTCGLPQVGGRRRPCRKGSIADHGNSQQRHPAAPDHRHLANDETASGRCPT